VLRGAPANLFFEPSAQLQVEVTETVPGSGACLLSGIALAPFSVYTARKVFATKPDSSSEDRLIKRCK